MQIKRMQITLHIKNTLRNNGRNYYYDSYMRLTLSEKQPTFKCNGTIMDKFGDGTTSMYVATLTADEFVYAGGTTNYIMDSTYYLINDYQKLRDSNTWLLSPAYSDDLGYESAYSFFIELFTESSIIANNLAALTYIRPAITLNSNTVINAGGDGTLEKPYEVKMN